MVQEHVRLQRTHEDESFCPRIAAPNHSRLHGPAEVVRDDSQASARRAVGGIGIEGHQKRPRALVHVDRDVFRDHFLHERDEPLGDVSEHDARVDGSVDAGKFEDEIGRSGDAAAHRSTEQLLLRAHMP
jgi:hypothetical protein